MYNMLIVDDERYAVQGISRGIRWSELGIDHVFEAYNYNQANRILSEERIDIMLADIEMPGKSGLELLQWINGQPFSPVTIFLTGHANFSFAQRAMDLNSFRYVLKPVDHEELRDIVRQAIAKYEESRERDAFGALYRKYLRLWEEQLPSLAERFWLDVFERKLPIRSEQAWRLMEQYEIPLRPDSGAGVIVAGIEEWRKEFSAKDESIMEFALRSAAADIFLADRSGHVVRDRQGLLVVLLYGDIDPEECRSRSRAYIEACNTYFYCSVSCYIGESASPDELPDVYSALTEMERRNTKSFNGVFMQPDADPEQPVPSPSFWLPDWYYLFDMGKKDELMRHLEELELSLYREESTTAETLETIYHGLIYMLQYAVRKKGLDPKGINGLDGGLSGRHACKSIPHLMLWAKKAVCGALEYMQAHGKDTLAIIGKVRQYIAANLAEELSRDRIAAGVYLNPAYLSRLYRQNTGQTLTDYIIQVRMEHAAKLLRATNDKISDVADRVGYTHFSHFSNTFKKHTGATPQEFRKKYNDMVD